MAIDLFGDRRGVTTVVGAILIFAILIIGLSIYQAEVVPAQNEKVEFNHYEDVQGHLQDVRNAIIGVAETNERRSARVQMGTSYPSRVMAVQPPGTAGEIYFESIGSGEMSVSGVNEIALCGVGEPTTAKSLTYVPYYYYLDGTPPIYYENTVLYRMTEDGSVIRESGQTLVTGSTINLAPLQGNVTRSGSSSTVLDFQGEVTGSTIITGPATITIPTRLSPEQWEGMLTDSTNNVESVSANTSRESAVDVILQPGQYRVRCTPVGVGTTPNANPSLQLQPNSENDSDTEINPSAPGEVILVDETRGEWYLHHVVNLELNNTAESDVHIQQARISVYSDSSGGWQGNSPEYANISGPGDANSATLHISGKYETLNPEIALQGQEETTVSLSFYAANDNPANIQSSDWFIVHFRYSDGSTRMYVVQVP